jgi:hypothetical protein
MIPMTRRTGHLWSQNWMIKRRTPALHPNFSVCAREPRLLSQESRPRSLNQTALHFERQRVPLRKIDRRRVARTRVSFGLARFAHK